MILSKLSEVQYLTAVPPYSHFPFKTDLFLHRHQAQLSSRKTLLKRNTQSKLIVTLYIYVVEI